ncbi:MAG: TIR domain-containing protein [Cyanobium sp.]
MARNRPQALVIQFFLDQVVDHSDLCDGGAVLVHVPAGAGHLKVWDLHTDINSLASWGEMKVALPSGMGISTVAFRKRDPEFAEIASQHPYYWWPEDCGPDEFADGPFYAVPIMLLDRRERREPFGVVAFKNRNRPMQLSDLKNMDLAVKALEAMMSLSPKKLVEANRVFIVHGHDREFREDLEKILRAENLEPVVIQSMARTGADLLGFLEEQIRNCLAGFILLTPDDEGRLYRYGERLNLRARQNVIFEGGYLTALFRDTNRICFLQKGEMEIPSDLSGLLMEKVPGAISPDRIRLTLEQWGLVPSRQGLQPQAKELDLPPNAKEEPAPPSAGESQDVVQAPGNGMEPLSPATPPHS